MAEMTRAERMRGIQEAYDTWVAKYATQVEPDPRYSHDGPSQYPEGIVAVSCTPEMDAEYMKMIAPYLTPVTGATDRKTQ